MSPDYRAGMMRAAEISSALSNKTFSDAALVKDSIDRISMKASATGMGEAAIAILTAIESGAGEDKP